jgi:hypothetical protein
VPLIDTGIGVVDDGPGRSERGGPLLKLPTMRPWATPWVDETVREPDCAVNDSPVQSLGVIPTIALVSVPGAGSPGMNLEPGLSESVCSAASAASPLSNLMKGCTDRRNSGVDCLR